MNDLTQPNAVISPDAHDAVVTNTSNNETFDSVLETRMSRRTLLKGTAGLAAGTFLSGSLTGCLDSGSDSPSFNFTAVAKHLNDVVSIPAGYSYSVLYAVGDPINTTTPAFRNDGTDSAWEFRAGDHHDGMDYFGLNATGNGRDAYNSNRGLLCINHENITEYFLHTAAEVAAYNTAARTAATIDKEVAAHGVSVIEVSKDSTGKFQVNRASSFNRRFTAATPMEIHGPARGHALMVTKYSTNGTMTRGTLNNCAHGVTPWGTYVTCEENWAGYFKRPTTTDNPNRTAKEVTALTRYGVTSSTGSYGWANSTTPGDLYDRWDATVKGGSASEDYRNVANTFGWVVEIDPYAPNSVARKRTALGRMGHEGAWFAKAVAGKPVVCYMGDDRVNEYIYKYVSNANWDPADAHRTDRLAVGDKYLNNGKLYVAKFNADGSGQWILLSMSNPTVANYAGYAFADEADVVTHCRIAADAVGATKMDRPEWGAIDPRTGEIYMTLTNNSNRGVSLAIDAANPRYYTDTKIGSTTTRRGNVNGHIVRWKEANNDGTATSFQWDVYLFGAQARVDAGGDDAYYQANVNLSGLTEENDFSSPDGLWFSYARQGLLWIQTDDGAYTDVTNCMMLAALPGKVADGKVVNVLNKAVPLAGNADVNQPTFVGRKAESGNLRRFLVGPKGCEITGITETPDGKTIFVNIQHPGENTSQADIADPTKYESHWPGGGMTRPRSATIVITKNDGGTIAV